MKNDKISKKFVTTCLTLSAILGASALLIVLITILTF